MEKQLKDAIKLIHCKSIAYLLQIHGKSIVKGVDILIDFYEINENLKRFNEILDEVGGSL
jgi:hypothetical protein